MAQKKKPQQQVKLTPENYIKTKARTLPIHACYLNSEWKESGLANILVVRKHTNGNFTLGSYLVDTFALGTKNTFFRFNISEEEYEALLEKLKSSIDTQVDYTLVHNIIYGANAFAEDNNFKIYKDFRITQYILEEDTDDIEFIDIEFGKDGKPFLII